MTPAQERALLALAIADTLETVRKRRGWHPTGARRSYTVGAWHPVGLAAVDVLCELAELGYVVFAPRRGEARTTLAGRRALAATFEPLEVARRG